MLFRKEKKCLSQKLFIIVLLLFVPCFFVLKNTKSASAASVNVSTATVDFWSSSSSEGQVSASVSLPWDANVGGSASNLQSFYLNSISMIYPITASTTETSVYGRLVMRFNPWFTSSSNVYFCDKNLNDYTSSVTGVLTSCTATVVYHYADNTSYTVNYPLYFNWTLPSGALNAYVDYNQSLPNTALTSIGLILQKTGSYDVYSISNAYSLVLTTLVSDASYYTGGGTDLTPLVNQNNVIINQNQQIIDENNQAVDNIEGQSSSDIPNSSSSQTTSIIGTISSFVTALGTVQASNCQLTLPFPQFIGGDTTVDVCSGKDKAPAIVSVGSSLFMIGVFVPFAFVVLKMIYNEIRSFTNG